MLPLVSYHIARTQGLVPFTGPLYEYWMSGNGLLLRAERPGLAAWVPIAPARVRGLPPLEPGIRLDAPRVPGAAVAKMLELARGAHDAGGHPVEQLYHLEWQRASARWWLTVPTQTQTAYSCEPHATGPGSSYASALIEVHSHHTMQAFWSDTDNRDEQGFRLYAVWGTIFRQPTLRVRVGIYGHFYELPARAVFDLPASLGINSGGSHHAADRDDEGEDVC